MIPAMWLRNEDQDPIDTARGLCWGLLLSLIAWAMAFLAAVGLWSAL